MSNVNLARAPDGGNLANLAEAISLIGSHVGEMRERMRLLEAVIENFPGGISLYDKDLRLVLCNRQQKMLLEYPDALWERGNPHLEDIFRFNAQRGEYGPGDPDMQVQRRMARVLDRTPHVYERTRPNGTIIEVRGAPIEGGGFVTIYLDVTEQRRNQQLVTHMAHHDPLTDLPNRMLFNDRLNTALATARRGGTMAVHYLDLDHFKPVNDNLGHRAGDELLVGVASRMRATIREADTVARLGGDEFAIVQTGIRNASDAAVLARRVLAQMLEPFDIDGRTVRIGISIGIAMAPQHGLKNDDILMKADAALHRAKCAGAGRYSFYAAA